MFQPDPASKQSALPVWPIPIAVCTVLDSWLWTRYCPKHVESYSKNKFEKLVLLVGFIIRMALCCESRMENINTPLRWNTEILALSLAVQPQHLKGLVILFRHFVVRSIQSDAFHTLWGYCIFLLLSFPRFLEPGGSFTLKIECNSHIPPCTLCSL